MNCNRDRFINKILLLLSVFGLSVLLFGLQKIVFLLIYTGSIGHAHQVVWNGLPLDFSVSGYFTAFPALLLLLCNVPLFYFNKNRAEKTSLFLLRLWFAFCSFLIAASFVFNCALYEYWRFPLDFSPVFFFTSSPLDAMASVVWWQVLATVLAVGLLFGLNYVLFRRLLQRFCPYAFLPLRGGYVILQLIFSALLILPIRGGWSVATMNTGYAYFSTNQTLNHSAVNPLFSFFESMMRQRNFADHYHYMNDAMAERLTANMIAKSSRKGAEGPKILRIDKPKPDVYIVVLEGFSDTLLKRKDVTPYLNRLKGEGIWFNRFYANSFRTDRGLVSILLGYPSPATYSLMKNPNLTAHIPSLATSMKNTGWGLKYYYGGDADFTNMRSFLINQGFQDIVEDVSFPLSKRLSKWGVPDHLLFERVTHDIKKSKKSAPMLRVIQTSSSHEPFDVPYKRFSDKVLNAFAYTDNCVGKFVEQLKQSGKWNNSLVIFVPDHLGAYPDDIDNFKSWRFHVPMIWTGGCIAQPMTVDTYASQQDIAATLLAQLGIGHEEFLFSKDIFDNGVSHFAYFMMNDGFGIIDNDNEVIYDNAQHRVLLNRGKKMGKNIVRGKAYTQLIFKDILSK